MVGRAFGEVIWLEGEEERVGVVVGLVLELEGHFGKWWESWWGDKVEKGWGIKRGCGCTSSSRMAPWRYPSIGRRCARSSPRSWVSDPYILSPRGPVLGVFHIL